MRTAFCGSLLLLLGPTLFIGAPPAHALSCLPLPENVLDRGDVIFAGTVTNITPDPNASNDDFGLRHSGTATFAVSEIWKGATGTPVTVHNIYAWGTAGPYFELGKKYIVFARNDLSSGALLASIDCGSTSLFSEEMADELGGTIAGRAPTTPSPVKPFTRNLTYGDSGSDVALLQHFLEDKGFLTMPAGVAKGYFGPRTRAALSQYQAARQITPAVGYFGPITRDRVGTEMADREGVI